MCPLGPLNLTTKCNWFEKVNPLLSYLKDAFKRYIILPVNISVDEMIVVYSGEFLKLLETYSKLICIVKTDQSSYTLKFTKKPIKEGFKFYVLAFAGYLYDFLLYSYVFQTVLFNKKVDSRFEKLKLCHTSKVVLQLAKSLPYTTFEYTIYLDNFFIKADLLHVL